MLCCAQLCAQNPIRRWLVCSQKKQKLYFTEALFLLYFILFTIPAVCTLKVPCCPARFSRSGIFMTHGWCWPKSKSRRKIYYTNFHGLVVYKGIYILFCGHLYPLQCFLNEDILHKPNLKVWFFFFLKEPLEGSTTCLLNTCWQLILVQWVLASAYCPSLGQGGNWSRNSKVEFFKGTYFFKEHICFKYSFQETA